MFPESLEAILMRPISGNYRAALMATQLLEATQKCGDGVSLNEVSRAFSKKLSDSGLERAAEETVDYFCSLALHQGDLMLEEMFKLVSVRDDIEAFVQLGICFPQSVDSIDQAFVSRILRQGKVSAMALLSLREDWKNGRWWYRRPPRPPGDPAETAKNRGRRGRS
jgi:hypothetical protein